MFNIRSSGILRPEAAGSMALWPEATGSVGAERTVTQYGFFGGDAQCQDFWHSAAGGRWVDGPVASGHGLGGRGLLVSRAAASESFQDVGKH